MVVVVSATIFVRPRPSRSRVKMLRVKMLRVKMLREPMHEPTSAQDSAETAPEGSWTRHDFWSRRGRARGGISIRGE